MNEPIVPAMVSSDDAQTTKTVYRAGATRATFLPVTDNFGRPGIAEGGR